MSHFIKKDLLIFWRDRKETLIALLLPILLIIVLNFALSGVMSDDEDNQLDLHLGIVNQDDQEVAMTVLQEKLVNEASFTEANALAVSESMYALQPVDQLFAYFNSEEIKDFVTVQKLDEDEANQRVEDGELDGILVIPEGYTAETLYSSITGEAPAAQLRYKLENNTNENNILFNVIDGFIDQLNYQFALSKVEGSENAIVHAPQGGVETVETHTPFTLTVAQYYAVTMGALFALFLAATVAIKTGEEIRQQVVNRIYISNAHPTQFLMGKMVSTFCLAWVQLLFVLLTSNFLLDVFPDRSASFWAGLMIIITLIALSIAGLSAAFTSLSLRVTNIDAANGLFMFVVIILGAIGGGFVPVYILPNWLQQIGEWTPNGLALVIYTDWVQNETVSSILLSSLLLVGFFLLLVVIGILLYPKRGNAK
ncbi:MAG: ABC transporter permease [Cytobacillus gottheilii]|uniref:ABC transporter permease n=1 Tax=Cytobacillus gottheilii TaxID=859144 RepID=UPI003464680B